MMADIFRVLVHAVLCASVASKSYASFDFKAEGSTEEHVVLSDTQQSYKVLSQVYYSQPFPLLPGQMLFTDLTKTLLPMPQGGKYAVTGMLGDIVRQDENGEITPASLTEVYNHHWIATPWGHTNELCPYGPNYAFGIGAESRNSLQSIPKGHGFLSSSDQPWGANLHLLRTDSGKDLVGDNSWVAAAQCAECYYDPNHLKGPHCLPANNGTFECCGDSCFDGTCSCATKPDTVMVARTYRLRYRLNYTYDVDAITPVKIGVFTTPDCAAFYGVYENNEQPESLSSTTLTIGADAEIMMMIGHAHTGGINTSVFINDKFVCASYPTYGTKEDVVGDELGHLVAMSTCFTADDNNGKGIVVKKGDKFRLDGWYWVGRNDSRLGPAPGGTHLNVMSYAFTVYKMLNEGTLMESAAEVPPSAGCKMGLKMKCGSLFGFPSECAKCAERHASELEQMGCEVSTAASACKYLSEHGGAPLPLNRARRPSEDILV